MKTKPPASTHNAFPALTSAAMREADRITIEDLGIPGFTLMESAGRGAADHIEKTYGPLAGKSVSIYCGKGNNGGDGMVVARQMIAKGAEVHLITLSDASQMSRDAAMNMGILQKLAEYHPSLPVRFTLFEDAAQISTFGETDLHVDALLGTGLTSALREPLSGLLDWLNAQPQPVVALDIPTGLHGDTGTILGKAVRADLTVTMGAIKTGLLINDGPSLTGRIEVVEIGIPSFVLDRVRTEPGCVQIATDDYIKEMLPVRSYHAHKYSVGLALIVAGSPGMTGAPVMAATAAARVGAGFVVCACPASVQPVIANKLTEITSVALPSDDTEGIHHQEGWDVLQERLGKARAVLIGCGMGRKAGTETFIRTFLRKAGCPLVIDADGLNALAGHTDILEIHARGQWILTPHEGEFKRLVGSDVDYTDRIRLAQEWASQWNCVLILKGLPSIVAGPDGQTFINRTGNPSLASAGTGDVLAGLCVGLLAQGLDPLQAAVAALHIGGAATDRYVNQYAMRTMQAMDIVTQLPFVIKERYQ